MENKSKTEKPGSLAHQNERRDVATAGSEAAFNRMDIRAAQNFFAKRGMSPATVAALTAHSVELPEELLFMTEEEIQEISNLGSTGLEEVRAYRARFAHRK